MLSKCDPIFSIASLLDLLSNAKFRCGAKKWTYVLWKLFVISGLFKPTNVN